MKNQAVSLVPSAGKKIWDRIRNIRGASLFILPDGTQFFSAMRARGVPPVFVALNRVDLKEE